MVHLNVFGDKQCVQDSSTTVIFHLTVNISTKCSSHSTECFVAIQSFLLTKWIHCFFESAFLKFCKLFLFFYWHSRKYTSELHIFINHYLKHKVVIFAEFLKVLYFSKIRGPQSATLVTINTFTVFFKDFP